MRCSHPMIFLSLITHKFYDRTTCVEMYLSKLASAVVQLDGASAHVYSMSREQISLVKYDREWSCKKSYALCRARLRCSWLMRIALLRFWRLLHAKLCIKNRTISQLQVVGDRGCRTQGRPGRIRCESMVGVDQRTEAQPL